MMQDIFRERHEKNIIFIPTKGVLLSSEFQLTEEEKQALMH